MYSSAVRSTRMPLYSSSMNLRRDMYKESFYSYVCTTKFKPGNSKVELGSGPGSDPWFVLSIRDLAVICNHTASPLKSAKSKPGIWNRESESVCKYARKGGFAEPGQAACGTDRPL